MAGRKYDRGKARWDLMPWGLLGAFARLLSGSMTAAKPSAPVADGPMLAPRLELVPRHALEEVGRVLAYGAAKYDDHNWRLVPRRRWRYFAAAIRHLVAWWRGEIVDPETRLHHLAHAACCVLFLCELDMGRGFDA